MHPGLIAKQETVTRPRRRARSRLPQPKEIDVQKAVLAHLDARAVHGVVWFHVPNGEYRPKATARRLAEMGVKAGVPDLVLVHDGVPMFLELKRRRGGRASDAQNMMHAALTVAGARVETALGLDEAIAVLERWGVLRGFSGGPDHG
jgi:hypothetical protein